MKKYILAISLLVALLFVIGCGKQAAETEETTTKATTTAPAKTVTTAPAKTVEPEATTEEEPETTTKEPEKVMNKQVAALLQKHIGRVSSVKYMYQDATNKPEEWETWVKGDKMHVKLREMDNVEGDIYVDNIYLDLAKKTAVGYCERNVYRCADPNQAVTVKFAKYFRKTPLEWIEEVSYAEKETEEQMSMRTVWKVKYTEGTKTTYMWVDDYYGLPVKVRIVDGSETTEYVYEDIAFNSVEDDDLSHGFVSASYN
jgi:outer membrane lipoprotein-sorting protein